MLPKILFLGTQMAVGGAQRVLFYQAKWFYEKGYKVTTAFLYDKENLQSQWDSEYPFPVFNLDSRKLGAHPAVNYILLMSGIIRLWNLLRKNQIDLIETFTPDSNMLGLLVARLAGVPIRIASHHGYIEGAGEWRKKLHGWMINRGFAHYLVAVSERVKRMAVQEEGILTDKVKVILNGIELVTDTPSKWETLETLREQLGIKPGDFVYLSVGRLTMQKGHTYLLDAIPKVLARFPENTVFLIAGDGHQRADLLAKSTQLGIDGVVYFLGNRSDIPDLLLIANVFVLPSLWEGLPLALLEAMGTGLPVVATRVEGVENVIIDGENGYLIPPKDVNSLGNALIEIREDAGARHLFGKRNVELIQREFTVDKMCNHYEDLFLQLYQQERSR